MKKHLWVLLVLFPVFFFASCDLSGESNYSPNIIFLRPVANNQDTLQIDFIKGEGPVMDTIQVGDTVMFYIRLLAYSNRLTAFSLKHLPAEASTLLLPPVSKMDSLFNSQSDYDKGDFYMDPLYSILDMSFRYVALAPSLDAKLDFMVVSDANFEGGQGSNTTQIRLKTPIKP